MSGLVLQNASVTYRQSAARSLTAVDSVSLSIDPGEVVGLVGVRQIDVGESDLRP